MKRIILFGVILALILGGASMASAAASGTAAKENTVMISEASKDELVEPMFWSRVAYAVGKQVGKYGAQYLLGSESVDDYLYDYEEIKTGFDF